MIIVNMNLDKSDLVEIIKTKVLPVIAILAVVVFFFVMVSDANKPETPSPTAAPTTAANPETDRQKQMVQMQKIIQHSDGNWDHLSAADQQVLNGVTGGHGRDALRMMPKRAKKMPEKSSGAPKP